ncbi:hypothetical protein J1N10_07255 [Carboxylicivirga sp. A043]|uniref:hypothetical protein n=1 Tax=Carboxylicivirga litoralis TaxID=2816963 RepID=UPI0021CB2E19|nr:hypothetical protein [Carboxylicivirga sp. A043]MCU4155770.1 hypothetical protein [Carboxylicivirga sp. A043]
MHFTKHRLNTYLYGVELLFGNSLKQNHIKDEVNKYGYDENQLIAVYNHKSDLEAIESQKHLAENEKKVLYNKKNLLANVVKRDYMRYLKLARIAFAENPKATEALMLNGARARTNKELMFQMSIFVSNLLNNKEWIVTLQGVNVGKEQIKKLEALLGEQNRLAEQCLEAKGEVKRLTDMKRKKLIELQRYVSEYVKVVRIAFEERPKLLLSLGIKVKKE